MGCVSDRMRSMRYELYRLHQSTSNSSIGKHVQEMPVKDIQEMLHQIRLLISRNVDHPPPVVWGNRDGAVVIRALAFHQCCPGFISRIRRHMWVGFVIGSRPCSERFFSGEYSGFPPPQKNNTSKFQFDLESDPKSSALR